MATSDGKISILMLPWLAHGHISPYLQLAKKLSNWQFNKFIIYFCSTPINLDSIKKSVIDENYSNSIKLVELELPYSPQLPPHYHTTNGLPPELMFMLKDAFELSSTAFAKILATIKPDLLLYDFNQPWAADIAISHNIPPVQFLTGSACFNAFGLHMIKKTGEAFPFPQLWPHGHRIGEPIDLSKIPEEYKKDMYRFLQSNERSRNVVLCKSLSEVEGKYMDYFSMLCNKKIVPVGPLVNENDQHKHKHKHKHILDWLDKKDENSVVFVSFGSEYFLSDDEMEEIAYGLAQSKVNFIWVVRFPLGEKFTLKESLPEHFIETVADRGIVVEGWAPQVKILKHKSVGGFVSHCGWSSVLESMKFGVPIIAMPMHLDQPVNARLVVEVGIGLEVARDEKGKVKREKVSGVINEVMGEKSGEGMRKKARELSDTINIKGDEEIGCVVKELLELCGNKNK